MIFFNFKNDVIYVNFFFNDFNSVNDCFDILDTNLYYNCRFDFKSMFILLCSRLLQTLI